MKLNTLNTSTNMPIYIRQVISDWQSNTITYANQPSKASINMGRFTTSKVSEEISVPLNVNELNNTIQQGNNFYGVELTDSSMDQNNTSSKTAWIFGTSSVNGAKCPKLEVIYYDSPNISLPEIYYNLYGNSNEWSNYSSNGAIASVTTGDYYTKALYMDMNAYGFNLGSLKYRVYFNETGWTEWSNEGEVAGDVSKNNMMRVIQIKLYNKGSTLESSYYDVYYRVNVGGEGWLGWAKNGESSGDYSGGQIRALQAVVVPRLYFKMNFLDGNKEKTSDENYYPQYPIAVGKGYNVYSIGVRFADINVGKKHVINTIVYDKSGKQISGSSSDSNTYVMVGGDIGNCLTGLRMQFTDADASSRFDIEHMICTVGNSEETWEKNTTLSGTSGGNNILEMISVRIVPKNYYEGRVACISDKFLPSEDGFSFVNGNDFGYPENYRIPEQKYIDLFGAVDGHNRYVSSTNWSGSCYGMALTSQFFYHGIWNNRQFRGNIDKVAESTYGLIKQLGRKSTSLRDLIEYSQLSFSLGNYGNLIENNMSAMVNAISKDNSTKYIMNIYERIPDGKGGYVTVSGHSVVPLRVSTKDGVNYKIFLYDPNSPGQENFATCNTSSNTFTYYDYGYNTATLLDIYQVFQNNDSKLQQIAIKAANPSYSMQSNRKKGQYSITLKDCAMCEITNDAGEDINKIKNVEKIFSLDGDFIKYLLPKGKYKINVEDAVDTSRISVLNFDMSVSYELKKRGTINLEFNDDDTIDTSVEFIDGKSHDIGVEIYDKNKNQQKKKFYVKKIKILGADNKKTSIKVEK